MSLQPIRAYRSSPEARFISKLRRGERHAEGWCINHDRIKATHGVRCAECYWRHRMGLNPAVWQRSLELQRELVRIARIR